MVIAASHRSEPMALLKRDFLMVLSRTNIEFHQTQTKKCQLKQANLLRRTDVLRQAGAMVVRVSSFIASLLLLLIGPWAPALEAFA